MKLAVASGKGGTGKTTVATNLAVTLARHGQSVVFADCDVEAPNGHLFLKPEISKETPVHRLVPKVDAARCIRCGACARICRFNAILSLPDRTLVYEELCHSCGGCALVCPAGAITEVPHQIGLVRIGAAGPVQFVSGALNVGEANGTPVVRSVRQSAPTADWSILDAPPGTACLMIETVRECDYVVLVTEPTPFGLHDLRLALQVARELKLECGVVVNRATPPMIELKQLCEGAQAPVLAEIPDRIDIAKAYSEGRLAVDALPDLQPIFDRLRKRLALMRPTSHQSPLPASIQASGASGKKGSAQHSQSDKAAAALPRPAAPAEGGPHER
ncbi:MAG: ATP-binding protein [Verrucomicrobiia bacterium]